MTRSAPRPIRWIVPALGLLLAAAACSGKKTEAARDGGDPAVAAALADPVMTDPELASQNKAVAAIAGGGPPVIDLPEVERGPDAVAAARDEAAKLAGRTIESAPEASEAALAGADAVTLGQLAGLVGGGTKCAARLAYSAAWATRLPPPLEIYPRGHLLVAAGVGQGGCNLRLVSFVTPVDPGDVIDFYYTRLKAAGFAGQHRLSAGADILSAAKGASRYAVRARARDAGLTQVDLVATGD